MAYSEPQNPNNPQQNKLLSASLPLSETTASPPKLSRRFFLGAGVGAVGTAAATLVPSDASAQNYSSPTCQTQATGLITDNTTACNPKQSPYPAYRLVEFNPTCVVSAQPVENKSYKEVNLPNLSVELGDFTYQCGVDATKQITARMFNGILPGPSMVLDAGDRIKLTIINNLPPSPINDFINNQKTNVGGGCPGKINAPNCFNSFNMHFHGLHVSPGSYCKSSDLTNARETDLALTGSENKVLSSDDVFYELRPHKTGQAIAPSHNWCVWLPDFHAPGTYWYHAHRHGSTGLQVSNGMAGAIIIREPQATQIVPPTEDRIWVIQEIILPGARANTQQMQDIAIYQRKGLAKQNVGKSSNTAGDFLVNGRFQPTVTLKAGQIQRWRFINANSTPRGFMNLKLLKVNSDPSTSPASKTDLDPTQGDAAPLWLIAVDGISFYGKPPTLIGCNTNATPEPGLPTAGSDGWDIASGNRADFLVKLDAGWYKVVKNTSASVQGGAAASQVLAWVKVEGAVSPEQTIPSTVPGIPLESPENPYKRYLRPITDAEVTSADGKITERLIDFSTSGQQGPGGYLINAGVNGSDGLFQPDVADVTVALNSAEQWNLKTTGGAGHPFHIHVNPFQIVGDKIDPNGPNDPTNWRFWDTIAVPRAAANGITIRSRFVDYVGSFVFHCHILIHEDQGMMKNITVERALPEPAQEAIYLSRAAAALPPGDAVPPCASLSSDGRYVIGEEAKAILGDGGYVCKFFPPVDPPTVATRQVDPDSNSSA